MSFFDEIKADALAMLQATANALHAQFARTLAQAGHDVTEDDPVEKLVACATCAGSVANAPATSAPVAIAPNYADAALATFNQSMTAALIGFAQQHLPEKFQATATNTIKGVSSALADGQIDGKEAANLAIGAALGAATAALPAALPAIAIAGSVITSPDTVIDNVIDNAAQIGTEVAASVADKVVPGAGEIVNALSELIKK